MTSFIKGEGDVCHRTEGRGRKHPKTFSAFQMYVSDAYFKPDMLFVVVIFEEKTPLKFPTSTCALRKIQYGMTAKPQLVFVIFFIFFCIG
jgi:hypothetical protein